jgi:predicted MFS family arabinose efflux permease
MDYRVSFHVGRVVKYFTIGDLIFWGGWGLLDPIFSVFIIEKIPGATLATVGISWGIYWVFRGTLQIPIASYLDKTKGESRDFRVLVIGLLILSFSSLGFIVVEKTWQLYGLQIVRAVGFSFYIPAWFAIFSKHLDLGRATFDWTLDNTGAGLAAGLSAFVGGLIATLWGFNALFIMCAALSMIAAAVLLKAPSLLFPPKTADATVPVKPIK